MRWLQTLSACGAAMSVTKHDACVADNELMLPDPLPTKCLEIRAELCMLVSLCSCSYMQVHVRCVADFDDMHNNSGVTPTAERQCIKRCMHILQQNNVRAGCLHVFRQCQGVMFACFQAMSARMTLEMLYSVHGILQLYQPALHNCQVCHV